MRSFSFEKNIDDKLLGTLHISKAKWFIGTILATWILWKILQKNSHKMINLYFKRRMLDNFDLEYIILILNIETKSYKANTYIYVQTYTSQHW